MKEKSAYTIIVVEDDQGFSTLLQKKLRAVGLTCRSAATAGEAVHVIADSKNPLLILDYFLPDMTAKELVQSLPQDYGNIPFLIVTAQGNEKAIVEMMQLGARNYLIKDIAALDLLPPIVERVIDQLDAEKDLRKAQEALQESETRYRTLYEHISNGVVIFKAVDNGSDFIFMDFNKMAEKMDGITKSALIGKSVLKLFPSAHSLGLLEVLRRVWKTGATEYYPVKLYEDGKIKAWREHFIYKLPSGEIVVVCSDDTQRRRAEDAVKESEERFRRSFLQAPFPIMIHTEKGTILQINKAWTDLSGYTPEELPDIETWFQKAYGKKPDTQKYVFQQLQHTVDEGEHFISTRSGSKRLWSFRSAPLGPLPDGRLAVITTATDVTERRRAEDALRENNDRFRAIAESSPDAIISADNRGSIIFWNRAARRIFGYTEEEVLGRSVQIVVPDRFKQSDNASFQNFLKAGIETDAISVQQISGRKKDGTEIPIEFSMSSWKIGEEFFFNAIIRDISERKQAEAALRQSEERFRSIVESIFDALFTTDSSGKIVFWSKSARRMYGYTSEEILGRPVQVLLPERMRQDDEDAMKKFFRTGILTHNGRTIDAPNLRKDGTEFMGEQSMSCWNMGGKTFITAIVRDISERRRTEEDRARLSSAVEQATEAIIIMDPGGNIQYTNPASDNIIGYKCEEMIGRNPFKIKNAPDEPFFYQKIWDTLSRGRAWNGQMKNRKADGSTGTLEVTISPILDQGGTITNHIFIGRDVTHEKSLEKRLRQAQKMEAIGTLAGGIAHDFNNILAAIIGYAEMGLYDKNVERRDLDFCFEQILIAGERARDLVNKILAFSSNREKKVQKIRVSSIINETLELLRASIPKTISINKHVTTGEDTIIADSTQVHQVLMNLCTNAAQAMRDKKAVLTITLDTASISTRIPDLEPGTYLRLSVQDTGTGMDAAIIDRIFDPFFTTKGPAEGTGMGLSVAHGIVKSLGGTITVESELGKGSTFHVYIPPAEGAIPGKKHKSVGKPIGGTENILFVDDEGAIVTLAEKMLSSLGYAVTAFTKSTEALETFKARPDAFDLVITDQTMPDLTGLELAREMLRIRPDLPIILCTGYSHSITPRKAVSLGIKKLIMKPIKRSTMAKAIRNALQP